MKKRLIYVTLVILCISFFSFRKECNNDAGETSFKKDIPGTIIPGNVQDELNFSPIKNLLKI